MIAKLTRKTNRLLKVLVDNYCFQLLSISNPNFVTWEGSHQKKTQMIYITFPGRTWKIFPHDSEVCLRICNCNIPKISVQDLWYFELQEHQQLQWLHNSYDKKNWPLYFSFKLWTMSINITGFSLQMRPNTNSDPYSIFLKKQVAVYEK